MIKRLMPRISWNNRGQFPHEWSKQNQLYVCAGAEMQLIFSTAAHTVLCFALGMRKVFWWCWAVLTQHQGPISNIPTSPAGRGWAKSIGYSQHQKLGKRRRKWDIPYLLLIFLRNLCVFWSFPGMGCWWEAKNKTFCFLLRLFVWPVLLFC